MAWAKYLEVQYFIPGSDLDPGDQTRDWILLQLPPGAAAGLPGVRGGAGGGDPPPVQLWRPGVQQR